MSKKTENVVRDTIAGAISSANLILVIANPEDPKCDQVLGLFKAELSNVPVALREEVEGSYIHGSKAVVIFRQVPKVADSIQEFLESCEIHSLDEIAVIFSVYSDKDSRFFENSCKKLDPINAFSVNFRVDPIKE